MLTVSSGSEGRQLVGIRDLGEQDEFSFSVARLAPCSVPAFTLTCCAVLASLLPSVPSPAPFDAFSIPRLQCNTLYYIPFSRLQ